MFCDCIQAEYSHSVIKPLISQEPNLDIEELLIQFYNELANKVAID